MIDFYNKILGVINKVRNDFSKQKILFLTSNDFGFGGSEDLWCLTAKRMAGMGFSVGVSVRGWHPEPLCIKELEDEGCMVFRRSFPLNRRDYLPILRFNPSLVVISQGSNFEANNWMKFLTKSGINYMNIIHCVHEACWPGVDDATIQETNELYLNSRKVFFVSEGNRKLHEKMTGCVLENAGIVRNPFKVSYYPEVNWPDEGSGLHVASVGRLECFHKGWDIFLEVLRQDKWKNRQIKFHFYGDGPHKELLKRLTKMWDIQNVSHEGHVANIEEIWRCNHALIQPSRLEGLPLTVVEAMLCNRMVIATDVAGHREVIDNDVTGFIAKAPTPEFVDEALERAWSRKEEWQEMGKKAGARIRTLIPEDPIGEFAAFLSKY